jgi:hypothetical protein
VLGGQRRLGTGDRWNNMTCRVVGAPREVNDARDPTPLEVGAISNRRPIVIACAGPHQSGLSGSVAPLATTPKWTRSPSRGREATCAAPPTSAHQQPGLRPDSALRKADDPDASRAMNPTLGRRPRRLQGRRRCAAELTDATDVAPRCGRRCDRSGGRGDRPRRRDRVPDPPRPEDRNLRVDARRRAPPHPRDDLAPRRVYRAEENCPNDFNPRAHDESASTAEGASDDPVTIDVTLGRRRCRPQSR